ncbi:MAG: cell division protein SepF [Acidobacteria bacterium]|nr:cell division protein SepF [Acidobacteriota bacterium]
MLRRAMHYLGLAPDDEYDDYADEPVNAGRVYAPPEPPDAHHAAVRPLPRELDPPSGPVPAVRRPAVVRPITPRSASPKPYAVSPESFNEAQSVADKYMAGVPVIMNLQDVDRDLSRRLVDFASGLCYGLQGSMERVTNQVYLLTPSNVEVSAEEKRRLRETDDE